MFHVLFCGSRGRLRWGVAVLLASSVTAALAASAVATSVGKRPPTKDPLERLWSEYPLNPEVRSPPPAVPKPSGRPAAGTDTSPPPSPAPPGTEAGDRSFPVWVAGVAAAAVALLLILVVRLRFGALHRPPLQTVRGGGGIAMSQRVRRFLGAKPGKPRVAAPSLAADGSNADRTVERLQPYLVKGSEVMTNESRSPSGDASPDPRSIEFGRSNWHVSI